VATLADEVGVDAPKVTVVRADAANVAVADGHRGSRLVVSTRLLSLPEADRDAALRTRARPAPDSGSARRDRAAPGARSGRDGGASGDPARRAPRRPDGGGPSRQSNPRGYEPERDRIPSWAYAVVGVALWILLLPAWVPATVGDRLYVAGGRRDADGTVARVGTAEREGLGNAVAFASDAAGAADWPPLLDRLSLISMADAETGRVRGTSRQEARTRLARIRSKRAL